jgi:diguanylate cyclase (GGDEF)-like protein
MTMAYYDEPPAELALQSGDRLADPLTGLPSAALFKDRVRHGLQGLPRRGGKLAVIFLDYSNFKDIAHKLAPLERPVLVKEAAAVLKAAVRDCDTVARITRDTFGILLYSDASYYELVQTIRRIGESLRNSVTRSGLSARPTMGVAVAPQDGLTVDVLLSTALKAADTCRLFGKNSLIAFASVGLRSQASNLEHEAATLRKALQAGNLYPVYQPRIKLSTGAYNGIEALLRWRTDLDQELTAAQFMPTAAEAAVDVELSSYTLSQACLDAASLAADAADRQLPVAVNLTTRQFFRKGLAAQIGLFLEKANLPPDLLEVEIPESVLLMDLSKVRAIILALSNIGVSLTVDDFGADSLNFRHIRGLPISRVKFAANLAHEQDIEFRKLTESLIAGARHESIITCAKAVETASTDAWLKGQGCDEAQGFYYGLPVVASTLNQAKPPPKP